MRWISKQLQIKPDPHNLKAVSATGVVMMRKGRYGVGEEQATCTQNGGRGLRHVNIGTTSYPS
jgi:hypothetical protein